MVADCNRNSTMTARFVLPPIQDNPTGWGPCAIPQQYQDMPYQPFAKSDRLGKVCLAASRLSCVYSRRRFMFLVADGPAERLRRWQIGRGPRIRTGELRVSSLFLCRC
ncbi:hypothetical protein HPB51_001390 [Rhipicephalus microplus]|uniref:Eukaryotic translation initiation factor 3 subunit p66 n=1 Tax=Rhipicephalus microplus TaxID=6941 RepID=A0A9J6DXT2_RHIMP|nr:hypothetical protein HPB51_001390 [Rhipicephalus microplus]